MKRLDIDLRALTAAATRRNVLIALTGGVLVAHVRAYGVENADARTYGSHHNHGKHHDHGKHKKHGGKHHRRRKHKAEPQIPLPPPAADPVIRADATCASAELGVNVLADPNSRLAQTFTALTSGKLVRADLDIASPLDSDGDFVLRLSPVRQSGETFPPTNDVLAEATVAAANVPNQVSTITFAFGTTFSVVADETYALVLSRPGGGQFAWFGHETNPCAGAPFFSPDQTAGFLDTSADLVFTTFVSS